MRTANGVDRGLSPIGVYRPAVRKAYRREAEVIYPPVDLERLYPVGGGARPGVCDGVAHGAV